MADSIDVEEAPQGSGGASYQGRVMADSSDVEEAQQGSGGASVNPAGSSSLLMVAPPEESPVDHLSSTILMAKREPMIAKMQDHFSLPTNSNLIRFRNKQNAARVYDEGLFQTVLEEEYDKKTDTSTVSVRQMKDLTSGTTILRISYSIVCALWTG